MLAGLLGAGPALADCSSDVAILKARVEREPDPLKAGPAKKQLLMAQVSAKDSEIECHNAVVRAYRILNAEPQPVRGGPHPTAPMPGQPWNTIR